MWHQATRAKLIELLSDGLGPARASEVVHRTADLLGMGQELSRQEVMRLLDRLTQHTGVVAVSACFAKSQVALRNDLPESLSARR